MSAKILIVDDDEHLAKIASTIFLRKGFFARTAFSGRQALEIASNWRPDVILLDLMMPDMSGIEVCGKLREDDLTSNTPIIIVSALASIEDKVRAFEAGADDYVIKPYDNNELVARTKTQLRRFSWRGEDQEPKDTIGKVIAVFSLRGGSGCTSLAVNLAVGISEIWGKKVPLIDLGAPIGSCDLMLNMRPRFNLGDFVHQVSTEDFSDDLINEALSEHETGVLLLGGFIEPQSAELLTEQHVRTILGYLKTHYPYVVVDTAHNLKSATVAALDLADEIIVPISPDINSVRVTHSMLKTFKQLDYPERKIKILPNWTFAANGLSRHQIEKAIKYEVLEPILHQGEWTAAINRGEPIILKEQQGQMAAQLEDLMWNLSHEYHRQQEPEEPSSMWARVARRQSV